MNPQEDSYTYVYSSIINNTTEVEMIEMSINPNCNGYSQDMSIIQDITQTLKNELLATKWINFERNQ